VTSRIVFVPGMKPKPAPHLYREQLLRALGAGLKRVRPNAFAWLNARPESFTLAAWSHIFYDTERDLALDIPAIDRLIAQEAPTKEDLRDLDSWRRRLARGWHRVADEIPVFGRLTAPLPLRATMDEVDRYLENRDGIGDAVRAPLHAALERVWAEGARVLLVAHSLGTVIAYDTLWELSQERPLVSELFERRRNGGGGASPSAQAKAHEASTRHEADTAEPHRRVDLFVTLGSPLTTAFIRRKLKGHNEPDDKRYPTNIRRWRNFAARGDVTALHPRLAPHFREMRDLGFVESIEDRCDLTNYYRTDVGLNAHEVYGYLIQGAVAEAVGDWINRGAGGG
jgi:hypothetical protein